MNNFLCSCLTVGQPGKDLLVLVFYLPYVEHVIETFRNRGIKVISVKVYNFTYLKFDNDFEI